MKFVSTLIALLSLSVLSIYAQNAQTLVVTTISYADTACTTPVINTTATYTINGGCYPINGSTTAFYTANVNGGAFTLCEYENSACTIPTNGLCTVGNNGVCDPFAGSQTGGLRTVFNGANGAGVNCWPKLDHDDDHTGYWDEIRVYQINPAYVGQNSLIQAVFQEFQNQYTQHDSLVEDFGFFNNATTYVHTTTWRDHVDANISYTLYGYMLNNYVTLQIYYGGFVEDFLELLEYHAGPEANFWKTVRIGHLTNPSVWNQTNIPQLITAPNTGLFSVIVGNAASDQDVLDYSNTFMVIPDYPANSAVPIWASQSSYRNSSAQIQTDSIVAQWTANNLANKVAIDTVYSGIIKNFYHSSPVTCPESVAPGYVGQVITYQAFGLDSSCSADNQIGNTITFTPNNTCQQGYSGSMVSSTSISFSVFESANCRAACLYNVCPSTCPMGTCCLALGRAGATNEYVIVNSITLGATTAATTAVQQTPQTTALPSGSAAYKTVLYYSDVQCSSVPLFITYTYTSSCSPAACNSLGGTVTETQCLANINGATLLSTSSQLVSVAQYASSTCSGTPNITYVYVGGQCTNNIGAHSSYTISGTTITGNTLCSTTCTNCQTVTQYTSGTCNNGVIATIVGSNVNPPPPPPSPSPVTVTTTTGHNAAGRVGFSLFVGLVALVAVLIL